MRRTVAIMAKHQADIHGLNASNARTLVVYLEQHADILAAKRMENGTVRLNTVDRVAPTYRMVDGWIEAALVKRTCE